MKPKRPPADSDWEPLHDADNEQIGWHNKKTGKVIGNLSSFEEEPAPAKLLEEPKPPPESAEAPPAPKTKPTKESSVEPVYDEDSEPIGARDITTPFRPEAFSSSAHSPPQARSKRIAIKTFWTLAALAIPIAGAVSCHNRDVEEAARTAQQAAEQRRALTSLLSETTMVAELDRRLAEKIKVSGSFISIRENFGAYTVSRTTPWFINCDVFAGLSVEFGTSPSNSNISVPLYSGSLRQADCDALIIPTAERYAAYVGTPAKTVTER